jgi:peptidyl-dipeptidase A
MLLGVCFMTAIRLFAILLGGFIILSVIHPTILAGPADNTARAREFVDAHVKLVRPLELAANRAWWAANTTGKAEDFAEKERAQNRIDQALSDAKKFQAVKEIKTAGGITDKLLAREIDLLYLAYLEKQVDPELLKKMSALGNKVEKDFNVYRAKVDGKEMTDSEVRKVLKESTDSARRQQVWEASKGVGSQVSADLRALVKLRNEAATKLGFKNFHALQLYLNEQNGDDIIKLFDELDALTRAPFAAAKAEIDQKLARNYNLPPDELMPWHYHDPFFQESPSVFASSLDAPYAKADLLRLVRDFYASIGLPIDDVIARSDLYEKPGKSPHAFCTDIDREGDVRVLANVVQNEYWMGTLLHELGHSVYSSKNIPASLPYLLRCESHILTTEGVAMMFERFSKQRPWMEKMGLKISDPASFDETARKMQRNQLLIFSRWCQVMLRFEKAMYENPDADLNEVWWGLVTKYQGIKKPAGRNAPDYASKIHIVSAPVYYHNYQMGQLFASQVHRAIAKALYPGADPKTVLYNGNRKVGEFMKEKVFVPGRSLSWNELTKFATGEELNARGFALDFQGN